MLENVLRYAGEFFSVIMLVAAVVVAATSAARHRGSPSDDFAEQLFRWVSLLAAGVVGLYTFACHVFAPAQTAEHIGWATSPFQYEVGMADLTMGVLGVLAFRRNFGFRLATTIAAVCWLGGDAVGHVRQIVTEGNYSPGNAGPWLWSDILVPLLMVATLPFTSREADAHIESER
jgi:hypothetical protein